MPAHRRCSTESSCSIVNAVPSSPKRGPPAWRARGVREERGRVVPPSLRLHRLDLGDVDRQQRAVSRVHSPEAVGHALVEQPVVVRRS